MGAGGALLLDMAQCLRNFRLLFHFNMRDDAERDFWHVHDDTSGWQPRGGAASLGVTIREHGYADMTGPAVGMRRDEDPAWVDSDAWGCLGLLFF